MPLGTRLWLGRMKRNAGRAVRPLGPIEDTLDRLAPGASFIDVGALWNVDGAVAFRAEERGATSVTAVDVSPETEGFREERARRGSSVRFEQGDLHDPDLRERAGPHDVVWCSGVLYHCPHPVQTLECLREITRRTLVLITATVPEIDRGGQAAVFFPGLSARQRRQYVRAYDATLGRGGERVGLDGPFDPAQGYANWWWGLTPSAVEGILGATGFSVSETKTNGFHTRIVADVA